MMNLLTVRKFDTVKGGANSQWRDARSPCPTGFSNRFDGTRGSICGDPAKGRKTTDAINGEDIRMRAEAGQDAASPTSERLLGATVERVVAASIFATSIAP